MDIGTTGHPPRNDADWRESLVMGARDFGVDLTPAQLGQFQLYLSLLLQWNERINLTSITDPGEVAALHFLDSITCLAASEFDENIRLIDIGSGAGLPGIPIAICRPDLHVTLLESTRKKCRFLESAIHELALDRLTVDCRRAEVAAHDPIVRETFDIAVSRALAELSVVAELCLAFVKTGGSALAMKGPNVAAEIERASGAIEPVGGEITDVKTFDIPTPDGAVGRTIVVMTKIAETPAKYPRHTGIPAKRRLGIDRPKRAE